MEFALTSHSDLYTEPSKQTKVFRHASCKAQLTPTDTKGVYMCPECLKIGYLVKPLPINM